MKQLNEGFVFLSVIGVFTILFIGIFLIMINIIPFANAEEVGKKLKVIKVVDAQTIAASGTYTSSAISLAVDVGVYSLQYAVTGDGTCKIEYNLTNNYTTYLEPSTAVDIASGLTKTSGPGSDGSDIVSFTPLPATSMKIKVTETGGANSVTISAWLATQ